MRGGGYIVAPCVCRYATSPSSGSLCPVSTAVDARRCLICSQPGDLMGGPSEDPVGGTNTSWRQRGDPIGLYRTLQDMHVCGAVLLAFTQLFRLEACETLESKTMVC